jgi:hypothetical protein
MKKLPRGRKVTVEQELELVRLYVDEGQAVAAARARELGVGDLYPMRAAAERGITRPRYLRTKYLPEYPNAKKSAKTLSTNTFNDPRWERAKKVGAILA